MIARRLTSLTLLVVIFLGGLSEPVRAQFTPRFSSQRKQSVGQMHLGLGATVMNIGDFSNAAWPELDEPVPVFHARLGYAIPVTGENWFLMTEIEVSTATTAGVWAEPYTNEPHTVEGVVQSGVALTAGVLYSTEGRKMLLGGGVGFHLVNHDPDRPGSMLAQGQFFLRDPFLHMGFGVHANIARKIAELSDTTFLMVEARYKVASLAGNLPRSLRSILMSEFQLSMFLAIK